MSLTVRGLGFAYGSGRTILEGVDLHVAAGRMVAVVGPSGSGKTTLLALAGGLLRPQRGVVEVGGRGTVGWIFQGTNVLTNRRVVDNVTLPVRMAGWSRAGADAAARDLLHSVGIGHLADQAAGDLSGGELQRACVARALIGQPALVLADEPTGQLDAANTRVVLAALATLGRRGCATVICTHDPLVATSCDAVYRLVGGELRPVDADVGGGAAGGLG